MKKVSFIFLLIVLFTSLLFARNQKVKIVKVYCNQWLQTADGRVLRLANVALPSLSDSDPLRRWVANKVQTYTHTYLLGAECLIDVDSSQLKIGAPLKVHLFKKYPLQKLNINKLFLEWGYGRYVPPAKEKYASVYAAAERKAKRMKKGIWREGLHYISKSRRVYALYYIRGGKNIFTGVTDFRNIGYHTFVNFPKSIFDLKIGMMQNAQKGRSCCECPSPDYYVEYLRYFKTGYLQIIFGRKWQGFTLSMGALAYVSGNNSYCSINEIIFGLSPIISFQYQWQKSYFAQIALTDDYALLYKDYPLTLSFGRKFKILDSKIWLGTVKERMHFGFLGGANVNWGPAVFTSAFGYKPYGEKWFAKFQIGLYSR